VSTTAPGRLAQAVEGPPADGTAARLSLFAFFICGILMSFLGAILPAWRYHLEESFTEIGNYFLSLNLGFLLTAGFARGLLTRRGAKFMLVLSSVVACGGFLFLAFASPPEPVYWRLAGLLWIGASAGLLNTGMFQVISPLYQADRAATTNLAGVLFGLGCALTALLVAGTYYVYNVPSILILLALIPGCAAVLYAKAKVPRTPVLGASVSQIWRDFQNPGAVLFSLLLFFQFGNEWSIAGWLPLFLIRRLGISPEASLLMLALYWAALLVGRILSQSAMKRVNYRILLVASILSARFGTVVLAFTNNRFGAVMGVLFVGAGFASIYPLVVMKISHRFPEYHPGVFNGLFSVAVTGGLLAPWSLGFIAGAWGIQAVMIVPMLGTCMVFLLVLLILLEAKLSGLPEVREGGV
jgi:FHS family glucose/mannose:H+ symporter-like MFS transporter